MSFVVPPRSGVSRTDASRRRCWASLSAIAGTVVALALPGGALASAFPGTNGKIVYAEINGAAAGQIFIANSDGSGATQLTTTGTNRVPRFSADGKSIVFDRSTGSGFAPQQLWIMHADGSGQTNLSAVDGSGTLSEEDPSFTPGGNILVARVDPSTFSSTGVFEMSATGTGVTPLTTGQDYNPTASPDGTKIAFTRYPGSSKPGAIYVADATGTGAHPLTAASTTLQDTADWSPDSKRIAFGLGSVGVHIVVANADGSGTPTDLTPTVTGEGNTHPAFSPDGTKILFVSDRTNAATNVGETGLFVMSATDGSGQTPVLDASQGPPLTTYDQPDWAVAPAAPDTTPPTITISSPHSGAHYAHGSSLAFSYACADGGSGVAACTGDKPSGTSLDTNQAGTFTLHVNASDNAGNKASSTVTYTVDAGGGTDAGALATVKALNKAIRSKFAHLTEAKLLRRGGITVTVTAKLAGRLSDKLLGKIGKNGQISSASGAKSVVVAKGTKKVTKAGKVKITIKLTNQGRTLIKASERQHHSVHLKSKATFAPSGGKAVVRSAALKLRA